MPWRLSPPLGSHLPAFQVWSTTPRKNLPTSSWRRRWYQSSPTTGMKFSLTIRMTSGSEKPSARPSTTLFQPHPIGLPSISQSMSGLPVWAAFLRASQRSTIQGMSSHLVSSARGLMRVLRESTSPIFGPSPAVRARRMVRSMPTMCSSLLDMGDPEPGECNRRLSTMLFGAGRIVTEFRSIDTPGGRQENGPPMDNSLAGKTALVTGGSRGIGKAIAHALYRAGARVIICGREARSLIAAAKEIGEILAVPADVRREKDVKKLFKVADRLDILVNNAGGMEHFGTFEETSLDAWRSTFELNLFSVVSVTRAAAPLLRKSRGCIVNIASDVGRRPFAMGPDYCAAKSALLNLTRYLAAELAPVRVNAVAPGPVPTGRWTPAEVKKAASRTVLNRTGTPEEVASAVLLAVKNGYLNGAVLGVDGGSVR